MSQRSLVRQQKPAQTRYTNETKIGMKQRSNLTSSTHYFFFFFFGLKMGTQNVLSKVTPEGGGKFPKMCNTFL